MRYILPFNGNPEFLDWLINVKEYHQFIKGVYFCGNPEIVSSGRKPKIQHFLRKNGDFLPTFDSASYNVFIKRFIIELVTHSIEPILLLNYKVTEYTAINRTSILKYLQELYDYGLRCFVVGDKNFLNIIDLKNEFKNITLYSSVYLEIRDLDNAKYFQDIGFDILTLDPGINRNIKLIEEIKKSIKSEISLLVNEGCFPYCSWRIGHMALDSTQSIDSTIKELVYGRNTNDYKQMKCRPYFNDYPTKILNSTWILPKDIERYESIVDHIKLDGRSLSLENLKTSIKAYIEKSFYGDLRQIIGTFTGMNFPLSVNKIPENFFDVITNNNIDNDYYNNIIMDMKQEWKGNSKNMFNKFNKVNDKEYLSLERSKKLYQKAEQLIWKGGPEAKQRARLEVYDYPNYLSEAKDVYIWDLDGNQYIDYLMAWGTVILGHCYPKVDESVIKQIRKGVLNNLSSEIEVHLAEKIISIIPCAECVRFLQTGSEASAVAIRIARAFTKRFKVIKYGYHGWHEWNQTDHPDGIHKELLKDVLDLKYNDAEQLERLFFENQNEIACVIMEPFKDEIPINGFLNKVKDLAHSNGALLIFDEIKTGFRLSLGGAQEYFNVIPDIAIFSKAVANGYPFALIAGKKNIFENAGNVWVNGTYHGSLPSIAAAYSTINILENEPVLENIWTSGRMLMDGFNYLMEKNGLNARLKGLPPLPKPRYTRDEKDIMVKFFSNMLRRGYYLHPTHVWFPSYLHSPEIIEKTILDMEMALQAAI